ncbi:hypothetical protein V8D89_003280 [Ganoderma adspersum]
MHRHVYISGTQIFLESFLSPDKSTSMNSESVQALNIFHGAPTTFTLEKVMYQWLCERLNNSGQFEGTEVFTSTDFKPDPSDDASTAGSLDQQQDDVELATEAWAQLLSYTALVFKFQKRLFHYSVIFFGHYARIVRFDRSGIVVTEKIDYTTDDGGVHLTQFFVRYGKFQSTDRGHDPSTTRVDDELARDMRKYGQAAAEQCPNDHVPPLFKKTLDEQWPWWKLKVYDEVTESSHYFAVGKPHFFSGGIVGRGTCGYIAVPLDENNKPTPLRIRKDGKTTLLNKDDDSAPLDTDGGKSRDVYFVYLKDTWRVDHPGMELEGAVLLALNQTEVQYVPTLLFHGDLAQDTLSYNNWSIYHPDEDPQGCPLEAHQHYRLVIAEVGKPLSEFANGVELIVAILCCVIAHKEACRAGYIHRDISVGNILLYSNGDNHFASDGQGEVRDHQVYRAGTWQFMSVHALLDPRRVITIADDLESLFHVLLYFAIRFLPNNCANAVVPLLVNYFDGYTDGAKRRSSGQMKYQAMNKGEIDITLVANRTQRGVLKFYINPSKPDSECTNNTDTAERLTKRRLHPINALIAELLGWFKALYSLVDNSKKKDGTKSTKPAAGRPIAKIPLLLPKSRGPGLNRRASSSASPASATPSTTAAADEALRAVAAKLQSHDAMEELLSRYITEKRWRTGDKIANLNVKPQPENGYTRPKDNVIPATASTKVCSKRDLAGGTEPSTKRVCQG